MFVYTAAAIQMLPTELTKVRKQETESFKNHFKTINWHFSRRKISRRIYPDSCRKSRYFTCWNSQSARHHNFYAYTQGVRDRGAYPDIRVLYHAYIIVSKFR